MPSLVVGDQIAAGTGGINQALAEGRGWSDEDVLAYAKTIGDNHPMFAETLEVRRRRITGWMAGYFRGSMQGIGG